MRRAHLAALVDPLARGGVRAVEDGRRRSSAECSGMDRGARPVGGSAPASLRPSSSALRFARCALAGARLGDLTRQCRTAAFAQSPPTSRRTISLAAFTALFANASDKQCSLLTLCDVQGALYAFDALGRGARASPRSILNLRASRSCAAGARPLAAWRRVVGRRVRRLARDVASAQFSSTGCGGR